MDAISLNGSTKICLAMFILVDFFFFFLQFQCIYNLKKCYAILFFLVLSWYYYFLCFCGICKHVHICVQVCLQRLEVDIGWVSFPYCFLLHFMRQDCSLNLELALLARLAGQ